MPLYEVTLRSQIGSVPTLNRWNYVSTGTPAAVSGSFALARVFGGIAGAGGVYPPDTILARISALVSNVLSFVDLTVINPYDPVDFYQTPFGTPYGGVKTNTAAPYYVSFGFRTNVVNRDIRRATKRFAGVTEGDMGVGGTIESSALAQMEALAEAMTTPLEYTDEAQPITFSPAVVKREKYEVPGSNPVRYAYRYIQVPGNTPAQNAAAQIAASALGIVWSPYNITRSQVSRQVGRGE